MLHAIAGNPRSTADGVLQLQGINQWGSVHVSKRRLSDELFGEDNGMKMIQLPAI